MSIPRHPRKCGAFRQITCPFRGRLAPCAQTRSSFPAITRRATLRGGMDAMGDRQWNSIGRLLALLYAAGWFAGTWIFTLVGFAIIAPSPPDAADRVAHYAYE